MQCLHAKIHKASMPDLRLGSSGYDSTAGAPSPSACISQLDPDLDVIMCDCSGPWHVIAHPVTSQAREAPAWCIVAWILDLRLSKCLLHEVSIQDCQSANLQLSWLVRPLNTDWGSTPQGGLLQR